MPYDAVMFDLDGTLADTLADIAAASNHALHALGRPTHPVAAYRYLAGQGLESLMVDALGPQHRHLVPQGMEHFRSYYQDHSEDRTRPYPGIAQLLDDLALMPVKLAVLSNKPDAATQQVVRRLFGRWSFDAVRGHRPPVALKPDPASALQVAAELGVAPDRWLYAGDTMVDMKTAKAAGMTAVGVLWGFRDEPELTASGADVIIRHPREIAAMLR